ncbi:Gamma-aminobutyric acid receptor alpha-like protein, partial [Stegodyphus mimosarum]
MGPVSEVDMSYSMDCYFRQSWVDRRLAYTSKMPTLALSISMLEKIWRPDTYFYNGKNSYLHTITTPNKFVRLYRDGRVLYSCRLTIRASCP